MPECHNCEHNGAGNDACLTCRGPSETNHKGQVFVSLDSGEDPQTAAMVEAVMEPLRMDAQEEGIALAGCCADTARRLLAYLAAMQKTDLSLVLARTDGQGMAEWGRSMGVSKQGVQQRWLAICRRHPELTALFP